MRRQSVRLIRVFRSAGERSRGRVVCGGLSWPCAIGRGGIAARKREGDGATPRGRLRALAVYYRADRVTRPVTRVPVGRIGRDLGWCDDPGSRRYNQPVALPSPVSHERMWRKDRLYDLVVDLSWNRGPIVAGLGSAIFLHAARRRFRPTEGCIALEPRALRRLVERIDDRTVIEIVG